MGKWAERSPPEQHDWDILGTVIGLAAAVIVFAVIRAYFSFRLMITASQRESSQLWRSPCYIYLHSLTFLLVYLYFPFDVMQDCMIVWRGQCFAQKSSSLTQTP